MIENNINNYTEFFYDISFYDYNNIDIQKFFYDDSFEDYDNIEKIIVIKEKNENINDLYTLYY
jgi:hypothetical protein